MATMIRSAKVLHFVMATTGTRRVLLALIFLATISEGRGSAQAKQTPVPPTSQTSVDGTASAVTAAAKADAADDGKVAGAKGSAAVRAKLLADTHMLLILSRELQAEAAKSTPNTFSIRLVKKSDEIQKLAAVVRAEMAGLQ